MKKTSKILSLVLVFIMLVSVFPYNVFAASYSVYLNHGPEGWGSEALPLTKTSGAALPLMHVRDSIFETYGMLPGYQVQNDQRVFIEWNTAYDPTTGRGIGESYYDNYTADKDAILYAIWGYNIRFNADGGVFPSTGNGTYLTYVADYNLKNQEDPKTDYQYCIPDLFGNTPTKQGCRRVLMSNGKPVYGLLRNDLSFFTWEGPDQNLTIPPVGGTVPWSAFHCVDTYRGQALEFFAIWEPSITYDANGGTGYMDVDYLDATLDALWNYEYYKVKNCAYTKSGAYFTGWNTKPDGTGVSVPVGTSFGGQMTNSDPIKLYAQWSDGLYNKPTHSHSYSSTVTRAATCTTPGVETYTCSCGDSYTETITALGHTWGDWTVTKAPTAASTGIETRTCGRCGTAETRDIPMLPDTPKPTVVSVDNYVVKIDNIKDIKEIRYAIGHYTTGNEVRSAEKNQTLSASLVAKYTVDGLMTYESPWSGEHTFWVRLNDGSEYFLYADVTDINTYLTAYGVRLTVNDFKDGYKDMWIAQGTWNSYSEIKNNAPWKFQAAKAKLDLYFANHDFSYTCVAPGEHTVLMRYADGREEAYHIDLTVDVPEFDENGLQVTINNIPDIKIIRTATGKFSTASEVKNAPDCRNFANKTVIKDALSYKIQYRNEGWITIVVEYNNGYQHIHNYYVQPKVPAFVQDGNKVTIGGLDDLYIIRYAPGKYTTANNIKNAPDSKYFKTTDVDENGNIVIELDKAGRWSFMVQYNDESYNFYLITVDEADVPVPEPCTHIWGDWEITTPATEEAEGVEARVCTLCGETETRSIPRLESVIPTATGIKVSSAFTDNMILQRDEKLSVWGTAHSSSGTVVVSLDGKTAAAEVDQYGIWHAVFDETFAYSTEPKTLTVSGADSKTVFNDVLIGDVYYMIGQSNVFYSMTMLTNEMSERGEPLDVDYDDSRNMRFFRISSMDYKEKTGVAAQGTETLYNDVFTDRPWQKPSDIGVDVANMEDNTYSALGYIYAYEMTEKTDVPVGVIEIDASGSPLMSFAPNELAEKWGYEQYDYSDGTYHHKIDDIEDETASTRYMYNQAIYPLSRFSCAGLIWYQGESDWYNVRDRLGLDSDNYFVPQFVELMNYYRSTFGNEDFPIYMVELPPCYPNNGENAYIDFGDIRAEMGNIPKYLSDCYFISSSDLWFDGLWQNNVHPPIKKNQAIRLSALVCAQKGFDDASIDDVHGPLVESIEYTSTGAVLTFAHVGDGIAVAHPELLGTELRGLEARVMFNGYPIWIDVTGEAFVDENTIAFDIGQEIYGVRYNAVTDKNFPYGVNLCNGYGMPAIAFVDYADKVIPAPIPDQVIPTATNVRVANAFTDNMVLQRDQPLSVWGFGDPGGIVVVNLGGRNACAKVGSDGTWKATFAEPFSYNYFKQPLTIRSGGADIVIKDVLIGDVYFLIGQSNVYYSMGEQQIDLAMKNMSDRVNVDYNDARSIRFFRVSSTDFSDWTGPLAQGTKVKFNDVYNGGVWMMPSDIKAQIDEYADFEPDTEQYDRYEVSKHVYSALGYQFAFNMCCRSPIPVGVIQIDAAGCPLITFAPNELANKWGHDTTGEDGTYHYKLNDVIEYPTTKSRFAYNQMIHPLSGFSTAGIIWYQGESDQYNIRQYFGQDYENGFPQQFTELMTYFRNSFGNSDFPVFLIEFPSCFYNNNANAYMDFGGVRAELGTIPQLLPESYIISSSDLWYDTTWWNNIHPYIKYAQAARLSEAVYQYYTMKSNLELVLGPQLNHVDYISDSKATVYFDHVGFGLTTAYENGYVKGIEVLIDVNGQLVWIPHEGNIITGHNSITIDTGSFKLYGVRYNANTEVRFPQQLTLCNSYKMPAIAFIDYR